MDTLLNAAKAIALIDGLEPLRTDLTHRQRLRLLAVALNYPTKKGMDPITVSELDELESLLRKHYRQ